jgi:hypothetical protein
MVAPLATRISWSSRLLRENFQNVRIWRVNENSKLFIRLNRSKLMSDVLCESVKVNAEMSSDICHFFCVKSAAYCIRNLITLDDFHGRNNFLGRKWCSRTEKLSNETLEFCSVMGKMAVVYCTLTIVLQIQGGFPSDVIVTSFYGGGDQLTPPWRPPKYICPWYSLSWVSTLLLWKLFIPQVQNPLNIPKPHHALRYHYQKGCLGRCKCFLTLLLIS